MLYNNPRFTKKKRFFKSIQDIRSAKLELENRKTSRWFKMVCLRIEDVYFCCVCNILTPPKLSMRHLTNQLILKLEINGPYIVNFCIVNMALVLILEIIDEQVNKKSIRLKNRLDFFLFSIHGSSASVLDSGRRHRTTLKESAS